MQVNTQISAEHRKNIAQQLSHLLADTYTLYLKTQNFHWNVTGPTFMMLHLMFEEQYESLAAAVDSIAERIRALGFPAPASFTQFQQLATIKDETKVLTAQEMIKQLLTDHESVIKTARALYPIAEKSVDEASADLATERLLEHEKTAWMLRSLLEG